MKIAFKYLLIAIPLILVGCKSTYYMQVDAISDPNAALGQSYVLRPAGEQAIAGDLRYKETAAWVKRALTQNGYREAADADSADMIVLIDYGAKEPREELEVYTEPVYAHYRRRGHSRIVTSIDPKSGHRVSYAVYVPGRIGFSFVGYQDRVYKKVIVEKYLDITAIENKPEATEDDPATALWSLFVLNGNSSADLRKHLPAMIAAASDYIGENTSEQITVKIREDDERIEAIRGPSI